MQRHSCALRHTACVLQPAARPRSLPQGLDEPKLVFQVLPARLRARQYEDLPTTGRTHSVSAHNSARMGSMAGSSGRTLASGGLSIRRAASDWVSAEGTPRQVRGAAAGW